MSNLETILMLYGIYEYCILYNSAEVKISDHIKSYKCLFNFSQTQGFSIIWFLMFHFKVFFLSVQHTQISRHLHVSSWNAIKGHLIEFFLHCPNKQNLKQDM